MIGKFHYMHVIIYKLHKTKIFEVLSQLNSRVIDFTEQFCL
ncbi:Uncharacterized protein BM_BM538 [Brugia malayi]|uniref:Bm538 n=1 Tax=Brugia malayi TaxID=6279 RepID=A0A0J9XXP2_BRUMA|nr:Uncharacterized protein BM_BM538 [Brugia malayi]CDP97434.1 Bm538 [Brugia malayi]VIO90072.1 Uncharacterized protein BM_BM538 [Brugia malayi]